MNQTNGEKGSLIDGIAAGISGVISSMIFYVLIGFGVGNIGGLLCNRFYCLLTPKQGLSIEVLLTLLVTVFLLFFFMGYRKGYSGLFHKD